MSDLKRATIEVLERVSNYTGLLRGRAGLIAMGAEGVLAALRAIYEEMTVNDRELDEIIRSFRRPRDLNLDWSKPNIEAEAGLEDTKRERPSSKAPPK